ncbi:hypothetical protein [Kangiella sp. TOML190]|uniref:hypothetical protein n=1 Tax=Kangiella sp. TOML190 TaxID=2931351 RepID=UPI00203FB587|nr:hypothetical protein [Kangiella sp. TOML190]
MKKLIHIAIAFSSLVLASASATELQSSQSSNNLSAATGACYIDTPRFDRLRPNKCYGITSPGGQSIATFGVLGLDQSSGQFTVQYLGGTCDTILYTTQEGLVCNRVIYAGQNLTQRAKVTDNTTGQSKTVTATAIYFSEPGF